MSLRIINEPTAAALAYGLDKKPIVPQCQETVSTYRSLLLEKLHLRSNAKLMRYAFKEGIMN